MRILWDHGVSIDYRDVKIILDPQVNQVNCDKVFISHAHFDHSKAFRRNRLKKFSSKETRDLISVYNSNIDNWEELVKESEVRISDVEIVPHNSGHVLGSYEFEIVTPDGTILFTGDFNTEYTMTMKPAEPVPCDVLVLEATFGSPYFVFPSGEDVARDMIIWARDSLKKGKIPTFQTDPLGNAQEVIRIFNESTDISVVTHWKVSRINKIYESHGYKFEYLDAKTDEADEVISRGETVFITPKGLNLSNHPKFITALVSGWALWSKGYAFPLSDHADFPKLMKFVEDCNPKLVLTCHGGRFNKTLARYIENKLKINAHPLQLISTNLVSKGDENRIRECETRILMITKVPGFIYSKRMIMKEVRKYGFSRLEINITLKKLVDKGLLKVEKNGVVLKKY